MKPISILVCAFLALSVSGDDSKQQIKHGIYNSGYGGHGSFDSGLSSYSNNGYAPRVITNTIPVPQPYPVTVEKKIIVPIKVTVDRPYPVHVPKPYPVHVEKAIPYKVDRPVPYPVKIPVKIPIIHRVEVLVPKPYPVPVDRPYPVPVPKPYIVEKKVPVYINAGSSHGLDYSGHKVNSYSHGGYSNRDFSRHRGLTSSYQHSIRH